MLLESTLTEVLILKGLTAVLGIGVMARYRLRSPLQKAGATDSHKKENAATWLPQQRLYLVVPEGDYSKIWFAAKGKRKKSEKDNAETLSALRFAERSEWESARTRQKRRQDRRTPRKAHSENLLCHWLVDLDGGAGDGGGDCIEAGGYGAG